MQKKARLAWTHKNHEQCLDNLISISRKIKGDFDLKIKMCHEMPPDEIGKQLDVIREKFTQEIANMSASMKIDQLALLTQKIHDENKSLQVSLHVILSNVAVGGTSPSAAAPTTTPCVTVAATVPSPPVSTINKIPPSNVFSIMMQTSKGGINEKGGAFVTISGIMLELYDAGKLHLLQTQHISTFINHVNTNAIKNEKYKLARALDLVDCLWTGEEHHQVISGKQKKAQRGQITEIFKKIDERAIQANACIRRCEKIDPRINAYWQGLGNCLSKQTVFDGQKYPNFFNLYHWIPDWHVWRDKEHMEKIPKAYLKLNDVEKKDNEHFSAYLA